MLLAQSLQPFMLLMPLQYEGLQMNRLFAHGPHGQVDARRIAQVVFFWHTVLAPACKMSP